MRNLDVIPAALSFLMHVRGINPTELAKRTRMSKPQLSKYLSGKTLPKLPQLLRLAEGLSVTPVQFFMVTDRIQDLKGRLGKRSKDRKVREADPVFASVLQAADEARREAETVEAEGRRRGPGAEDGWPRKFLLAQKLAQRSNLLYLEALEECYGQAAARHRNDEDEEDEEDDDEPPSEPPE